MRIQISLNSRQVSISGTNKNCPKCESSVVATERRRNGDSICSDCSYKGPTTEFMRAQAQVDLEKLPTANPLNPKDAPYGYCPICNDKGTMREKRPNGNDVCARNHSYPSASALPSPIGQHCSECENPEGKEAHINEQGKYVNEHSHPAL